MTENELVDRLARAMVVPTENLADRWDSLSPERLEVWRVRARRVLAELRRIRDEHPR